ncbi:hypothetical protein [Rhodococcus sp. USK13]|uniref:Rv1733c family protein n=1 Tax=Rhodococcus sp. USK13 TaxID=2806442 RepID=UPI001BCB3147|nr:hypothetical protein [Rhodococcus sp. USK13]
MDSDQPLTLRWWRLAPWSRNSLMRPSDRFESLAALMTTLFVLLLVPCAAAFGTVSYTDLSEQSRTDRANRHVTTAVLVDDPKPRMDDGYTRSPLTHDYASARWLSSDGSSRTGNVEAPPRAMAGDTVEVWIDSNGDIVDAPRTGTENAALAVSAAMSVWAIGATTAILLLVITRWVGARNRMRQWDREWCTVDRTPGWTIN